MLSAVVQLESAALLIVSRDAASSTTTSWRHVPLLLHTLTMVLAKQVVVQ